MSADSEISWTDDTFNPWWGCHKVSDECLNCYAESTAERFHPGHWGLKAPRWFFNDKHWDQPRRTARDAAARHGVAFHFKQWNATSTDAVHGMRAENNNGTKGKIHLPILDGVQHDAVPEAPHA